MKRKYYLFTAAMSLCLAGTARAEQHIVSSSSTAEVTTPLPHREGPGEGLEGLDQLPRKKVAVVLSGGGAKGMAHIGALKVIERAGIPVDIVTGTSMGSIIGGMYALGYKADQLDSIVRVQDWNYVITDRENLALQSLDDRQKQNTYAVSMGITKGKRNATDGGIIKGKNLAELFAQLCAGYTDSIDFNRDLPIPFACVATNIVDNTEIDFHSGRLPQAMRASMAIPGAFSPVRVGDMVLVDGGLRNNYPADIAREMGADIIIGVTVQGPPKTAKDLGGTMSIIGQIVDVNCKNKYDENLAITDVAIRANTEGYSAASFTPAAIDTLIRRGEEEAMKHWDELLAIKKRIGDIPLSSSDEGTIKGKTKEAPSGAVGGASPVVEYVFQNMTEKDEKFLRGKFHLKNADLNSQTSNLTDSIDAERIQLLTTSMRVDLMYQTAECYTEPITSPTSHSSPLTPGVPVRVILTAGNRKTAQLNVGLRYDTEEYAALQLGVDIPLRGQLPTDLGVTLRLGKRMMAHTELTFHQRSFTMPKIGFTFRRNDLDIYINGDRGYNIRDNELQAEVLPINLNARNVNLQIGLRWDYQHYRNKLEASHTKAVEFSDEHYYSYRARIRYNSEDNWNFPTRGARFKAEYAYLTDNFAKLGGKIGMSDVSANWRGSLTLGSRFTVQPMLYGRMLFGSVVPLFYSNAIGGDWFGHYVEQQMPFAGIGNIEIVNNQFVAAQLQGQLRISDKHYVLLRVAGAQQAEKLKNIFDTKTLIGFQGAYYFDTMFGPLGATIGYSNRTKSGYFYLNLGHEF